MDAFTDLTQGFLSMFETGGEILLGWMTTILPMVVCLMTAVSAVVKLIGESRVERITKFLTRWRIARYTLLPLMAILFLGNPLCFTFGKFLDEKYKTAYYDACVSFLHPVTGLFPHANAVRIGNPLFYGRTCHHGTAWYHNGADIRLFESEKGRAEANGGSGCGGKKGCLETATGSACYKRKRRMGWTASFTGR